MHRLKCLIPHAKLTDHHDEDEGRRDEQNDREAEDKGWRETREGGRGQLELARVSLCERVENEKREEKETKEKGRERENKGMPH